MRSSGFTFIEVLFALFIVGLMSVTIGFTLILSLRSEEKGQSLQEGLLVLASHHAAVELELDDSAWSDHPVWRVSDEIVTLGDTRTQTVWKVTRILHPQSDFQTAIAFRDGPE